MYETETFERALGRVPAPRDLWARIEQARTPPPAPRVRKLAWALTAALSFAAIAWNLPRPEIRSEDPEQIRAWARERTGLDIPFVAHARSVDLTGARMKRKGIEIAYFAGGRKATVAVWKASPGEAAHWSSGGISYALACDAPGDLACRICHLDGEPN